MKKIIWLSENDALIQLDGGMRIAGRQLIIVDGNGNSVGSILCTYRSYCGCVTRLLQVVTDSLSPQFASRQRREGRSVRFVICSDCGSPIMRESHGDFVGSPVMKSCPSLSTRRPGGTCCVAGIIDGKREFILEKEET